ncbi:hypothetical protein DPMN_085089 [Dreissena polymorpha]|uniref:Uncharacterized protein n=1 Tax=Dreissena polymorpha TaxID=45954 RepID=A0A9D3YF18_DREPO|nr:hypothetical protein DPMN_085089 [Dreissena polymorpha]
MWTDVKDRRTKTGHKSSPEQSKCLASIIEAEYLNAKVPFPYIKAKNPVFEHFYKQQSLWTKFHFIVRHANLGIRHILPPNTPEIQSPLWRNRPRVRDYVGKIQKKLQNNIEKKLQKSKMPDKERWSGAEIRILSFAECLVWTGCRTKGALPHYGRIGVKMPNAEEAVILGQSPEWQQFQEPIEDEGKYKVLGDLISQDINISNFTAMGTVGYFNMFTTLTVTMLDLNHLGNSLKRELNKAPFLKGMHKAANSKNQSPG